MVCFHTWSCRHHHATQGFKLFLLNVTVYRIVISLGWIRASQYKVEMLLVWFSLVVLTCSSWYTKITSRIIYRIYIHIIKIQWRLKPRVLFNTVNERGGFLEIWGKHSKMQAHFSVCCCHHAKAWNSRVIGLSIPLGVSPNYYLFNDIIYRYDNDIIFPFILLAFLLRWD